MMQKIPLTIEQLEELSKIDELILSINTFDETKGSKEEKLELIKELSKKHIVVKSYLNPISKKTTEDAIVDRIVQMNDDANAILNPVYEKLIEFAYQSCLSLYHTLEGYKGVTKPVLYKYQKAQIRYLLKSIIKKEFSEHIYTLLMSRQSGKTRSLSVVVTFLLLFWDKVIYHSTTADFRILLTTPFEKQLDAFKGYIMDYVIVAKANGMIFNTETELHDAIESGANLPTKLWESKNNAEQLDLRTENGGLYSMLITKVTSKSLESASANLAILDEAKMISKDIFATSLLPVLGGRDGILLCISSASQERCYFQDLVSQNCLFDYELREQGIEMHIQGVFNEKGYEHRGELLFVSNFRTMIEDNRGYIFSLNKAINSIPGASIDDIHAITDPAFLSQYENIFLSDKQSSFFDLTEMSMIGAFKTYHPSNYRTNGYVLVASWDVAVTGDNSIVTIKAFENKIGVSRRSFLVETFCLNPRKDNVLENIQNQARHFVEIANSFDCKAIVVDTTGIGYGLDITIKEILRDKQYYNVTQDNVFSYNINSKTRFELLENYYKRLQSGLEIFPSILENWKDEKYLQRQYGLKTDLHDNDSAYIKFLYEHVKFSRRLEYNNKTGTEYILFESMRSVHDDFVLSSALCSQVLNLNPNLINGNANINSDKKIMFAFSKGRSWR